MDNKDKIQWSLLHNRKPYPTMQRQVSNKIGLFILLSLLISQLSMASIPLDIVIKGIDDPLKTNAIESLSLNAQKNIASISMDQIKRLHKKAPAEIQQALQPFGYYHSQVQSTFLEVDAGKWLARYVVNKGRPIRITNLDIKLEGQGKEDAPFFNFVNDFPLNTNNILNHQQYETTKATFLDIATERGYLDAVFIESKIIVDLENYAATIVLHFKTGKRYRFGNISFNQSILHDTFLQSFSPFKPGAPYSVPDLLELQKTLSNSNYFTQAQINASPQPSLGLDVPVNIDLTPRKRTRWIFGIGYGTDDSLRSRAGWENRRINRKGHRIKTKIKVSGIEDEESIQYFVPIQYYEREQYVITGSRTHTYAIGNITGTIVNKLAVNRSVARGQWRETTGVSYQLEDDSVYLIPSVGWLRINADNQIYVQRGSRVNFDIRGSSKALLSDTTFTQLEAQGKTVRSLNKKTRFLSRVHAAMSIVSKFNQIEPSLRFRAGGDQSVRGYKFESLGPDNDGINGGKHLLTTSIELEHTFVGKWSAALFFDAGNAFNSINQSDIKQGIGIGIRWLSPLGLIRLDAASPPENITFKNTRLHFVVGPDL